MSENSNQFLTLVVSIIGLAISLGLCGIQSEISQLRRAVDRASKWQPHRCRGRECTRCVRR